MEITPNVPLSVAYLWRLRSATNEIIKTSTTRSVVRRLKAQYPGSRVTKQTLGTEVVDAHS